jgi:hypothetical protein
MVARKGKRGERERKHLPPMEPAALSGAVYWSKTKSEALAILLHKIKKRHK